MSLLYRYLALRSCLSAHRASLFTHTTHSPQYIWDLSQPNTSLKSNTNYIGITLLPLHCYDGDDGKLSCEENLTQFIIIVHSDWSVARGLEGKMVINLSPVKVKLRPDIVNT